MDIPAEYRQAIAGFFAAFGATILVLGAAVVVYRFASMATTRLGERGYFPEELIRVIRRILRVACVVLTILLLLHVYGLLGDAVAAISGVMALVAIGFVAVWSVLSNTLCSLLLLIIRPFRVGDTLRVPPPEDFAGKVVNFDLLFTTIQLDDGSFAQLPNNVFFQRIIIRRPGRSKIDLGEQLYEEKNAKV